MTTASKLRSLARNLFRRERVEQDLDEEVRSYAGLLADQGISDGLNPDEARRRALMDVGGIEQVKEQVREVRMGTRLEMIWQDLRYGARMLRKNPGFSAAAALTLALGIGANAAIFTLTYAVILKSLPVPDPGQLVRYTFRNGNQDLGLSGPAFDALAKRESVLAGALAWTQNDLDLSENGTVTRVSGALMSGNGFRVLDLQPMRGRTFTDSDDVTGGGANGYQALLGYDYWIRHFQGNAAVLGRSLNINGRSVTVIGILPRGFDGLTAGMPTDVLLPLSFEEVINAPHPMRHYGGSFWLTVLGRLQPGQTLKSAEANLRSTETAVREDADPTHRFLGGFFAGFQIGVESGSAGRSYLRLFYSRPLQILEILVGFLLLLCSANAALLVLARVSSRYREFAVRSALGAPRIRLCRQVLMEVGILAAIGLGAGLWFGWIAARFLVSTLVEAGGRAPLDVTPGAAILTFTAGVTLLAVLVAGVWPALRAGRAAPAVDLKEGQALASLRSLGSWIVSAQVAVSVTLLASASLLGGTFLHLLLEHSGVDPRGLALANVDLSASKLKDAQATLDARQIVQALAATPGIEATSVLTLPPLSNGWSAWHFFSLGPRGAVHSDMQVWGEAVLPGYFAAMGTHLREGRDFANGDLGSAPLCVLSESAAAYFFPGEDALGKFVYGGGADPNLDGKSPVDPKNTCRVIGIAEDARFRSLHEAPPRMIYSLAGDDDIGSQFTVIVRGRDSIAVSGAIRDVFHRVVPAAPLPAVLSFGDLVRQHLRQELMLTALSVCFAAIALLLTALGLYGLLARSVLLRTREIGLRLALGAPRRDALLLVVGQGMRLVLVGAAIGIGLALVLTRVLRSLLFGIRPTDPITLAAVVALLGVVALLASYIPARRATKLNPTEALRYE